MKTVAAARVERPGGALKPCAADPERMFPLNESAHVGQAPTAGERAALAVCRRCPLMEACRAEAQVMKLPYGVAGGLTAAQRRAVRAERIRPARVERTGSGAAGTADVGTAAASEPPIGDPVIEAVDLLFRVRHDLTPDVLRSLASIWTCASAARYGAPHERFWELDAEGHFYDEHEGERV